MIVVVKAPNPLTRAGFDKTVIGLMKEMAGVAAPAEKAGLEGALQKLDQDWATQTPEQRSAAIRAANKVYVGLTENVGPKIGKIVLTKGPPIIEGVKVAVKYRDDLKITPHLNAVDARQIEATANQQANFVRDEFGRRSERFSAVARGIVSTGLRDGWDRYEIGARLSEVLNDTSARRADSYWRLVASVFVSRAHSYGTLSSFDEAGIERFEFIAVMDEVTTDVCRFMNGKVFSVGRGLKRFSEVEQAQDPESVTNLQPWVTTGKDENGNKGLFFKQDGARQLAANIVSSAVGAQDASGSYSNELSADSLQAKGISTPPLHGHCRSTVVPA